MYQSEICAAKNITILSKIIMLNNLESLKKTLKYFLRCLNILGLIVKLTGIEKKRGLTTLTHILVHIYIYLACPA